MLKGTGTSEFSIPKLHVRVRTVSAFACRYVRVQTARFLLMTATDFFAALNLLTISNNLVSILDFERIGKLALIHNFATSAATSYFKSVNSGNFFKNFAFVC